MKLFTKNIMELFVHMQSVSNRTFPRGRGLGTRLSCLSFPFVTMQELQEHISINLHCVNISHMLNTFVKIP